MQNYLPLLKCDDVDVFLLNASENLVVETVVEKVTELDAVSNSLRRESVTISQAHAIFNTVIAFFHPFVTDLCDIMDKDTDR